jgi:hypothetical protein
LEDEEDDETTEAPVKSTTLENPIVSPRDPNHYRIIELDNGFRAILISTCGYGTEAAEEELREEDDKKACISRLPETSVFNR